MTRVIFILNRVLAIEFYKFNAVLFLLITGLCFGFMSGSEHKALAQFFVTSPLFLLIPISFWCMYLLKVIHFNNTALQLPQNEFVFHFNIFPRSHQWLFILPVLSYQLIPVIGYGTFLIITAIHYNYISSAVCITLSICCLIIIGALVFIYAINNPNRKKEVSNLKKSLDRNFTKPYFLFYIEWILRRDLATIIGTKLFTCLLFYGVISLYGTDDYDGRLLAMGSAVVFSGNLMQVFHFHQLENFHFTILRNLPFYLSQRIFHFMLTFALLCVPEFIVLVQNFPDKLIFTFEISIVVLGLSIGILFYTYLLLPNMVLERIIKHAFGLTMLWIVAILFGVYIWAIAILNLAVASFFFKKYYYSFEVFPHTSRAIRN